jgi:hypothetical protein
MRYMETIPREPAMTAPSATELIAMRPEIVELGGTERVDNRPSRARGALAIGLLTALVSFGLGGRWFGPTADPAGPTPSAAAQASVEPDPEPVTIDAPLDGDVIRSNVIAVRGHTGIEISEVWLVGRLERLVLGERRASVRDGVITADLMVVAPIDAPVTALDLVIETRDGGRSTTLATRRVTVAPRSPVTLGSVRLDASDGAPRLDLAGTAPVGTVVEVSVEPTHGSELGIAGPRIAAAATFDDTWLPFGLGRWVCSLPMAGLPSKLAIDVRWVSPTGQVGSILLTRVGSDLDSGLEGS